MPAIDYRGYTIENDPVYSHRVIKASKGALPKALQGYFTNPDFAKRAVDGYLDAKEVINAPANSTA